MRWPRRRYAVLRFRSTGGGTVVSRHWTMRGATQSVIWYRQMTERLPEPDRSLISYEIGIKG